ncbi:MAG: hypothetical protein AB7F50_08915 [Fimbriimonadaceae bacterium]
MSQDPYALLGTTPEASEREVRRAYRAKAYELEESASGQADYPARKEELEAAFEHVLKHARPNVAVDAPQLTEADSKKLPEATRKIATRFGIGVLVIAGLFVAWQVARNKLVDPYGDSPLETAGWIAAIEEDDTGSRAVVFQADGTKVPSPADSGESNDSEVVWRPDGHRVFVVGSRGKSSFDIYRWNPKDGKFESRTFGSMSKTALYYGPAGWPDLVASGLLVSGGQVYDYDQRTREMRQVLPPQFKERRTEGSAAEGEGSVGQMEAMYKEIGTSFIRAIWGKDRKWIWCVMASEAGQVLVYQPLEAPKAEDGTSSGIPRPFKVLEAERVELTVDADGQAFVTTAGQTTLDLDVTTGYMEKYQETLTKRIQTAGLERIGSESEKAAMMATIEDSVRKELLADERTARETKVYLVFGDGGPRAGIQPIAGLTDPSNRFSQPAASPVDDRIAVVVHTMNPQTKKMEPGLVVLARSGPPVGVTQGEVSDPSWSPDGKKLTFIMRDPSGKRGVFVADLVGQRLEQVGKGGNYSKPKFSPQG